MISFLLPWCSSLQKLLYIVGDTFEHLKISPKLCSRLIFGILFCLKRENKKLKIEQSFYTSKVLLNTFKPLHNGHLGDRRKWLLLRSFVTWAPHSWQLVDTISRYTVDIIISQISVDMAAEYQLTRQSTSVGRLLVDMLANVLANSWPRVGKHVSWEIIHHLGGGHCQEV